MQSTTSSYYISLSKKNRGLVGERDFILMNLFLIREEGFPKSPH